MEATGTPAGNFFRMTLGQPAHRFFGAWTLMGLLLTGLASTVSASAIPIRFRPGHSHARAVGRLRGIRDQAIFVFSARSGQHLRVSIRGQGSTHGVVTFPSGRQDGGPGGVVFESVVHETGRYHLRVTENSMAMAWRGRVVVTMTRQ